MKKSLLLVSLICAGLTLVGPYALSNQRTEDPLGVAVSPQTLLLGSTQGGSVVVHTAIPYRLVDRGSLTLNGVAVRWSKADSCGNLVAYFSETAIKAIVQPPSEVMTLEGQMADGTPFAGSDTVRVIP